MCVSQALGPMIEIRDKDLADIYLLPPGEDPETCVTWLRECDMPLLHTHTHTHTHAHCRSPLLTIQSLTRSFRAQLSHS